MVGEAVGPLGSCISPHHRRATRCAAKPAAPVARADGPFQWPLAAGPRYRS